ncbi:MAG: hypothetical protein AAGM22_25465 [Acidobacteriota bacterium]
MSPGKSLLGDAATGQLNTLMLISAWASLALALTRYRDLDRSGLWLWPGAAHLAFLLAAASGLCARWALFQETHLARTASLVQLTFVALGGLALGLYFVSAARRRRIESCARLLREKRS